jgi:hypothetical protein
MGGSAAAGAAVNGLPRPDRLVFAAGGARKRIRIQCVSDCTPARRGVNHLKAIDWKKRAIPAAQEEAEMDAQTNQEKHSLSDCIPMVAMARALAGNGSERSTQTGASRHAGRPGAAAETDRHLIAASRHFVANF